MKNHLKINEHESTRNRLRWGNCGFIRTTDYYPYVQVQKENGSLGSPPLYLDRISWPPDLAGSVDPFCMLTKHILPWIVFFHIWRSLAKEFPKQSSKKYVFCKNDCHNRSIVCSYPLLCRVKKDDRHIRTMKAIASPTTWQLQKGPLHGEIVTPSRKKSSQIVGLPNFMNLCIPALIVLCSKMRQNPLLLIAKNGVFDF
uniref:Transmembrane protein n=1 Tax=Echinococcus granulosus TaxID=6210 RepID=A0A068WPS8_ECHGR|nr:hypothetical protein EgrG_000055200 [Echinococcus granulosus]